MFHHKAENADRKIIFFNWFLLNFLAGSVNAGGFMATERFVTHVTGFATLFGIDIVKGKFDQAFGILSVPIFFLSGAMVSAYLIDRNIRRKKKPHYDYVMFAVFLCLVTCAISGYFNKFGIFGAKLRLQQDYIFLALLCLASGLQNAAITTASHGTVRSTHLTGITTDLGIEIVKIATTKTKASAVEKRNLTLKLGSLFFFILGSVTGAALFIQLQYLGFLLPASIALYSTIKAKRESHLD